MGGSGSDRGQRGKRTGSRRAQSRFGRRLGRRLDQHGPTVLGDPTANNRRPAHQRHHRILPADPVCQRNRSELDILACVGWTFILVRQHKRTGMNIHPAKATLANFFAIEVDIANSIA